MKTFNVGILGATGMVGQQFISLLANHPWFNVTCVAASARSAGKPYAEAMKERWSRTDPIPKDVAGLNVYEVEADMKTITEQVDFVFSAMSLDKEKIKEIEIAYAELDVPVCSNNSAHRWTEDVPMMMPEINPEHVELIHIQRKNRGWNKGLIAVKPNCSIQSYVPVMDALKEFGLEKAIVSTYQAISGAGKTLETAPEILDNVIPYIGGEEQKSEDEPMKIWGTLEKNQLVMAEKPVISANCIRVATEDGHLVSVNMTFTHKPSRKQILEALENYKNPIAELNLPSSPDKFITYFEEENRPQTKLDRMVGNGMGITCGRFREDNVMDWKFVALSHNTIRGAAGGAILTAELLAKKGFIE